VQVTAVTRQLIRPVLFTGTGLHSGARSCLRVEPAAHGAGYRFVLSTGAVPARLARAVPACRHTVLRSGALTVATPEHVLAALAGLGIWDAELHLDGADEVPSMDGSALPFVRALAGVSRPAETRPGWRVARPFSLSMGASACLLAPAPELILECSIHFDHPRIGRQRIQLRVDEERFVTRLAPARTFGMVGEAAQLRRAGLARGASLGNVLVFAERGVLNPGGTRFVDEPVRHKLLDAVGDLALLGGPLRGRVRLRRPGHRLVQQGLSRALDAGALVRCG
jgi:UDP-3-O-[3-hydroxymyristoyl] N-acetylglucosamine deacetylase